MSAENEKLTICFTVYEVPKTPNDMFHEVMADTAAVNLVLLNFWLKSKNG